MDACLRLLVGSNRVGVFPSVPRFPKNKDVTYTAMLPCAPAAIFAVHVRTYGTYGNPSESFVLCCQGPVLS